MSNTRRNLFAEQALRFAVSCDGIATGLPVPTRSYLTRLGYAEPFTYRDSFSGDPSLIWYNKAHTGCRLTAAGFEAVNQPYRTGRIRLVFKGSDRTSDRVVLLLCHAGKLRVSSAQLGFVPTTTRGGIIIPPYQGEVSDHDDMASALEAFSYALDVARATAGVEGKLMDPGHLAWDGGVFSIEDMASLDVGGCPSADEVLEQLRAVFTPDLDMAAAPAPSM